MSWKWSQASSTGTGTVNSCVSSTSRVSSECRAGRAERPDRRSPEARLSIGLGRLGPGRLQHGTAGEHGREVLAVVGVAVQVTRRVRAVGGVLGRRADGLVGGRGAGERRLRRPTPAAGSSPCWSARSCASAIVPPSALHGRGDGDDRPLVRDPDELLVVRAPAGVLGDPDLGQDLVLADRGLEEVDEEVLCRRPSGCRRTRRSRTRRRARAPPDPCRPPGRRARSEPPNVPRCRIWWSATSAAALDSSRACSRTSVVGQTSWCVVSAPMTMASPSSRTPRRLVDATEVDRRARERRAASAGRAGGSGPRP